MQQIKELPHKVVVAEEEEKGDKERASFVLKMDNGLFLARSPCCFAIWSWQRDEKDYFKARLASKTDMVTWLGTVVNWRWK